MLPRTVKVKEEAPTVTVAGETDAIAGAAGELIAKAVDACPPPGAGFEIVSCTVPLVARSVAETAVVN